MEKTIYAVDFVDWGIEEAYENYETAKKVVLKKYLEWVKEHNERAKNENNWGKEFTTDDMYDDIMLLMNEGYIDDYAYIQTMTLHTEVIDSAIPNR